MSSPQDPKQYVHRAAVDPDGSRVGKISQVYLDDNTGQPLWVLVETGLFGTRLNFAPAHGARLDGDLVVLAVSKDQIKDSPSLGKDEQLGEGEQEALRQHYSGYLGTAGDTGGYEQSGRASQWESGQTPASGGPEA